MKNLNYKELKTISGGIDIQADKNMVVYDKEYSLYGTIVVPPSKKEQLVLLTVQVVDNTFINSLLS